MRSNGELEEKDVIVIFRQINVYMEFKFAPLNNPNFLLKAYMTVSNIRVQI